MNIKRKKQEYYFKRNLILEAAKKIFFEKGFDLATIDDIATKANYSKGSIYSYFKSKNEICFSIVNGYYKDILELFRGINELNISGLKKLIKIKEQFVKTYAESVDFCKIYDSFNHHKNQCMEAEKEIFKNKVYNNEIKEILLQIIVDGIEDKSIKDSVDPEKLANALWNDGISFIAELRNIDKNSYNYLYDLIIDSIKI
jgi:AcrR family transcriptional regulator